MTVVFVAFILLAALLLWFIIGARGLWWAKLGALVLAFAFAFALWSLVTTGSGYPTNAALPGQGQFVACEVVQPDPAAHNAGAVYLWVIPLNANPGPLDYHPAPNEPRAYKLPYSDDLYRLCRQASKAQAQGAAVGIAGRGHGTAQGSADRKPHLYLLPSPKPPAKGGQG